MQYLVDFKNSVSEPAIAAYLAANNCTVIKEWDNFEKAYLVESATSPPVTEDIEFVIEDVPLLIKPLDFVNSDPWIGTHKDPNEEKVIAYVKDKKDWWKNYCYVNPVFEEETISLSRKGKGIKVYIMDSGIEQTHPDLENADIQNLYTVTPGDYSDARGHGTAIASVIAGKTCGITRASIKNVKIFHPGHSTLQSELLSALDVVIEDHVDNTYSILNCSWAIPRNPWVEHKLRQLIDEGVWLICSAGNNGTSIEDVTPSAMYEALTVGSYNQNLTPSDFSNYTGQSIISLTESHTNGGELDGWAPGEDIWAAGLNGQYGFVSGTSIAAAVLSAVVASNLDLYTNDDGTRMDGATDWQLNSINPSAQAALAFGRPDLLDLSNEKYKESKNLVATLQDRTETFKLYPPDEFVLVCRAGLKEMGNFVFEPTLTEKIEEIEALPTFCKILPIGNLFTSPLAEDGPQNGELYRLYESSMNRYKFDSAEPELIKIKIYVLAENVNLEDIPNDHEIKITLQGFCSGQFYFSCGALFTTGQSCIDRCGGGGCCYQGKGTYQCICFSDERLKTNVEKIGVHSLGINVYEYDIMGKRETGVMAQDLLKIMPSAVTQNLNGYYKVNYNLIDINDRLG